MPFEAGRTLAGGRELDLEILLLRHLDEVAARASAAPAPPE